MEEVPANVHLRPINTEVLMRQDEHSFIVLLLGAHMLPDMFGSLIHVRYISLLDDFDSIQTYNRQIEQDPCAPLGAIWCTSFDLSQLPIHVLLTYRDQLDFMPSDQSISKI
ncbi:hypothetical protein M9H77_18152 [Catharanthus roseus]|uniref:Uncharacterized protein n=1 Tax=Catharanthus roseus TaxID=4058 RepID=A0ACC0B6M7_CATRO|nr:hypothetical protein M9H77_18152 [Catharanthus roseus]